MDLIIKGFIIGIGKVIPGVSGAMLALTIGIYEPILEKISNLKKDITKNIFFLGKIAVGILLAIIMTSKIIVKCLNNYYFPTMLLFIGMIIGGIKDITKEIKLDKKSLILIVILILLIALLPNQPTLPKEIKYTPLFFLSLVIIGFLDAASSIIPGISGTALLMNLGYYNIIIEMFSTLINPNHITKNIFIVIPFSIGIIIGIIIISKILNYLFKKHKKLTYTLIFILIIITTISLIKQTLISPYTYKDILIGLPLFILGIVTSTKLGNK